MVAHRRHRSRTGSGRKQECLRRPAWCRGERADVFLSRRPSGTAWRLVASRRGEGGAGGAEWRGQEHADAAPQRHSARGGSPSASAGLPWSTPICRRSAPRSAWSSRTPTTAVSRRRCSRTLPSGRCTWALPEDEVRRRARPALAQVGMARVCRATSVPPPQHRREESASPSPPCWPWSPESWCSTSRLGGPRPARPTPLIELLRELPRTCSSRPTTCAWCGVVAAHVIMDEGRIVADGATDRLLAEMSRFSKLMGYNLPIPHRHTISHSLNLSITRLAGYNFPIPHRQ